MSGDHADARCVDEQTGHLLAAYEMGVLDAEEERRFERHAADCPACAAQLLEMAPFVDAMRSAAARCIEPAAESPPATAGTVWIRLRGWLARLGGLRRGAPGTARDVVSSLAGRCAAIARIEPLAYQVLPTRTAGRAESSRRFDDGAAAYAAARYPEAITTLRACLDADEQQPQLVPATRDQAHLLVGVALLMESRHGEALEPLERARASSLPVVADRAAWYRAQALLALGEAEQASATLRGLADGSPTYAAQASQQLLELARLTE